MTNTLVTATRTLRQARQSVGLTQKELAELSNINANTISHIENDSYPYATHEGVAWAIADALYIDVNSIIWPRGLSSHGRPPHTGKAFEMTSTDVGTACDSCWTIKAANGACQC